MDILIVVITEISTVLLFQFKIAVGSRWHPLAFLPRPALGRPERSLSLVLGHKLNELI